MIMLATLLSWHTHMYKEASHLVIMLGVPERHWTWKSIINVSSFTYEGGKGGDMGYLLILQGVNAWNICR